MKQSSNIFIFLVLIGFLYSCGAVRPYYDKRYTNWTAAEAPPESRIKYSVFLMGDPGSPSLDKQEPSFRLLETMLYKTDTVIKPRIDTGTNGVTGLMDTIINYTSNVNHTVIWMGDNVYYDGLPREDENDRDEKERVLLEQINAVNRIKGRSIWIPGNHDWDEMGPDGLAAVNRQERFIEAHFDSLDVFIPSNGCPGPIEVHLGPDLVVIILDSQWWLHRYEKPIGAENGCNVESEFDLIVQLDDAIKRNEGKNILLCQHHPLFSNSSHGGWFTGLDYLFPLRLVRDNWIGYIPLPIAFIYPLMRQYGISRQDMTNPVYAKLKSGILSVIENNPNVVMATGHDHNLQIKKYQEIFHLVSGSACKDNFVRKGNDAIFAYEHEGFIRLNYYANGEVWAEAWIPEDDGSVGKMVFRTPMYSRLPADVADFSIDELPDYTDSTITVAAGPEYKASGFKTFLFGNHYRDVWTTPVKVSYLDLKREAGGLTPLRKGGGMQTISLRLQDPNKVQYNLRLINKDPEAVLPEGFRTTFAKDIVQDQISAAHPYGAYALPGMEKTINIYHTDPELFYVPNTPLLGPYIQEFGNSLAMLEIRPDEDLSSFDRFGKTRNAVSTRTLYRHLYEDNDNYVDASKFLRARLFDMLIGDWDRHEDQWRWAEFKKDKGSEFEPIARDRDQVFFKFDGFLPWFASRKWAVRKLQSFKHNFGDIKGLNFNGTHLDRRLLTEMNREDWIKQAKRIQTQLTDSVIEASVKGMPPEAFELSGEEIISKLKSRREQMVDVAEEYYEILAKEVDIVGSNKHEYFEVERLNNQETRVTVYKTKKEGEIRKKLYERIFYTKETREIRLYGLGGQDSFKITGKVRKGPQIRIVGGPDKDEFINESRNSKIGRDIAYYDNEIDSNVIIKGRDSKVITSDEDWVNEYDPEDFKYDYMGPRLFVEYNIDDGVFLGGGLYLETHSFRKEPAESTQKLLANYATATQAYTFKYDGKFYSFFKRNWDLQINAIGYGPKYVLNYFGQGNATEETKPINYYRIKLNNIILNPSVNHRLSEFIVYGIGPFFEYVKVEPNPGTIIHDPEFPDIKADNPEYFTGGKFFMDFDLRDDDNFTTRGALWTNKINYYLQLEGGDANFLSMSTDFRFFLTPNLGFPATFAFRLGGATNIGDYNFYQSNFLGSTSNLRGYRKTRFAGRSSLYSNLDVRIPFFKFSGYVLSGNGGVIGFADIGRVWADNEGTSAWHMGYGPGAFINFYQRFVVSSHLGFSEEGRFITVDFGFFF